MSLTRSFRFHFAALALILGASTANAQLTPSSNPVTLPSYTRWSDTPTSVQFTVTSVQASIAYTATTGADWFTVTCGGTANSTTGDTCTINVITSSADNDPVLTPYTFTITLNDGTDPIVTVTVNMPVVTPSPLFTGAVGLSYISHGVANQSAATATATIHSHDAIADTYTVQSSSVPAWLTVTPTAGHASSGSPDTCVFTVVQGGAQGADSLSAGSNPASVHLQIAGKADLVVTVNLTVYAQQPLTTTTTSLSFAYTIGAAATVPVSSTAAIKVASGTQAFTVDQSTLPAWLVGVTGVSPASATANSVAGATITFTPTLVVVKALTAGNYSGSVGFLATGSPSGSELTIPVTLTVSNPTATLSYKGLASTSTILNFPGATIPTPVVTVISSDEPTGFSATCVVTTTNQTYVNTPTSCTLSGNTTPAATVTGIAYTYGTALTTTFDPALFSYTAFGAVITETVTITGGAGAPVHQIFIYSVQPIAPTFATTGPISPTSAAQMIASPDSLVVTLTGTNFVGPGSILNGAISPTKVYAGAHDETANAVVINSTTMVVSIPGGDFPAYPSGKTTVNMVIGLANQTTGTAPGAPTTTQNLVVTSAPVVYAVTSTATYLQPSPGTKPKVVPYELVSIFGANFGMAGPVSGTLSSYYQFGTSVTSSGVALSVSFKSSGSSTSYKAPILFANATQINLAIPAELTVGQNASVTVTAGTASSDGLFAVTVAASDPGIFTLSSQGVGAGAILNFDYTVNSVSNPAAVASFVQIYMTGLGIPTSAGVDEASGLTQLTCVAINGTTANPGYLQVVNTANPHATPAYTPPSPAWTSLDGAAINPAMLLDHTHALPPCFTALPTVTFTPVAGGSGIPGTVTYAGFVSGSVAGLYQVNATVPGAAAGAYYVTVGTSPVGVVTVQLQ